MKRPLIIGIGNPLRGDDAAGWRLAEACGAALPDGAASVFECHQLTPELVERIHAASFVVFFDAAAGDAPGTIASRTLHAVPAEKGALPLTHHLDAEELLALAAVVHGAAPDAVLITVTGGSFGFGETLSPAVSAALPHAVGEALVHLTPARREVAT